ncbi:hypothetical protein, partial [Klebsiella pneumoniae]|uniref:hypothetical protein n=1 Tax=Klebsiella pneumoniae TaxID=573 RepID=UPI001954D2F7
LGGKPGIDAGRGSDAVDEIFDHVMSPRCKNGSGLIVDPPEVAAIWLSGLRRASSEHSRRPVSKSRSL